MSVCYHIVFVFVILANTRDGVEAQQLKSPAVDFERHAIVWPIVYHGRTKREINSTKDTAGDHHKQVTVKIDVESKQYLLDLQLNENLLPKNYVISYQKNGETVLHEPTKEALTFKELDICQYRGTVRDQPGSWVALSTCRGISGVIHDGYTTKYIEPAGDDGIDAQHFIYDHSDLNIPYHRSQSNNAVNNEQLLNDHRSDQSRDTERTSRYKRQVNITNSETRYIELVLVADNRESKNGVGNVVNTCKDLINIVNSLFAPLNIVVSLVGVVVWDEVDQIQLDEDMIFTLLRFMNYRHLKLLPNITNDYAHLLTHQNFTGDRIGGAYTRGICHNIFSTGVTVLFSQIKGLIASTVAHEIGHSLGMLDDSGDCNCNDKKCIMSETVELNAIPETSWSDCSINSLYYTYSIGKDHCLRNKPEPICKNGTTATSWTSCATVINP